MTIEFIRQWQNFMPGRRSDQLNEGAMHELIRRGIAKIVIPAQDKAFKGGEIKSKVKKKWRSAPTH